MTQVEGQLSRGAIVRVHNRHHCLERQGAKRIAILDHDVGILGISLPASVSAMKVRSGTENV